MLGRFLALPPLTRHAPRAAAASPLLDARCRVFAVRARRRGGFEGEEAADAGEEEYEEEPLPESERRRRPPPNNATERRRFAAFADDGDGGGASTTTSQRYRRVYDKSQLSRDEADDVARRLREGDINNHNNTNNPLRVFRHGVDDLRLYKALDGAGLEGRVVVADSLARASAVLAARNKRGGRQLDLSEAKRAAAAAGVPFIVLSAVSPTAVLNALAPLLGMSDEEMRARHVAADASSSAPRDALSRSGASLLRAADADADGAEALLALLYGGGAAGAARFLATRVARLPDPTPWVAEADVEDAREGETDGRSPTDLAAARYPMRKPMRHGTRVARRKLVRELRDKHAPW